MASPALGPASGCGSRPPGPRHSLWDPEVPGGRGAPSRAMAGQEPWAGVDQTARRTCSARLVRNTLIDLSLARSRVATSPTNAPVSLWSLWAIWDAVLPYDRHPQMLTGAPVSRWRNRPLPAAEGVAFRRVQRVRPKGGLLGPARGLTCCEMALLQLKSPSASK
jgi:hypothetical protein